MQYKYSILTVNFNDYEILKTPGFYRDDIEFVCVTNNPNLKSDVWKMIYYEEHYYNVKLQPFNFVSSDVCFWLDCSFYLMNDPTNAFIQPFIDSDDEIAIGIHSSNHNLFEELCYWRNLRDLLDDEFDVTTKFLIEHNYHIQGLVATGCWVIKKTNNINKLFNDTYSLVCRLSEKIGRMIRNEQVILSYILCTEFYRWNKIRFLSLENITDNNYFYICIHGTDEGLFKYGKAFKQDNYIYFDKVQKNIFYIE